MRLHEAAPKLIIQEQLGDKVKVSSYWPVPELTRAGLTLGRLHTLSHPSQNFMNPGCFHKTVLLHVPLIFASHIFFLVGRTPQLAPHFSLMPFQLIFLSQEGDITLQMLVLPHQRNCLSPIKMCYTICLNGIKPRKCKFFFFCQNFSLTFFQVHATLRSCLICIMH